MARPDQKIKPQNLHRPAGLEHENQEQEYRWTGDIAKPKEERDPTGGALYGKDQFCKTGDGHSDDGQKNDRRHRRGREHDNPDAA